MIAFDHGRHTEKIYRFLSEAKFWDTVMLKNKKIQIMKKEINEF